MISKNKELLLNNNHYNNYKYEVVNIHVVQSSELAIYQQKCTIPIATSLPLAIILCTVPQNSKLRPMR